MDAPAALEAIRELMDGVEWNAGGGCTAWRVPLPFGYILITDMDGATHDLAFDSPALLGIYDNDDNAVTECWHSPRAADALSQARTILDAIVVDERAGADRIADAKAAIDAIDNALSGIER